MFIEMAIAYSGRSIHMSNSIVRVQILATQENKMRVVFVFS